VVLGIDLQRGLAAPSALKEVPNEHSTESEDKAAATTPMTIDLRFAPLGLETSVVI